MISKLKHHLANLHESTESTEQKISDSTCKAKVAMKTTFEVERRALKAERKTFEAKWARAEAIIEAMRLKSALRETKGRLV